MLEDGEQLEADGIVELFEIVCPNGLSLALKQNDTVSYMGKTYEGTAIQISGVSKRSDGEQSRPTLTVTNPLGIYNTLAVSGNFEFARVDRTRVLRKHLLANLDVKQVNSWYIYQVAQCDDEVISFSLRAITDRFNSYLPARMFIPPDFPMVTLK
jgi:lambda family phage minor tail protein L